MLCVSLTTSGRSLHVLTQMQQERGVKTCFMSLTTLDRSLHVLTQMQHERSDKASCV